MNILKKTHSGQVALIMVLIMTVIGAVAVSMASRSTVETRSQEMSAESTEAMLAAQAGLEQASSLQTGVTGTLATGKTYEVTVATEGTTGVITEKINSGETVDVNLVGALPALTGIRIYWKSATVSATSAIFVSDVRSDKTYDYAFDTSGSNGFTKIVSGGNLNGVSFNYVTPSIAIANPLSKSIRITAVGAPLFIGVEPVGVGAQFPPQTRNYRSVGNVGAATGNVVVKYGIEYKESATDQIPSVFGYALFANGSIIQ